MLKKLISLFLLLCLAFCLTACDTFNSGVPKTTLPTIQSRPSLDPSVNYVALPEGIQFGMTEGQVTTIMNEYDFQSYGENMIYVYHYYDDRDPIYNSYEQDTYLISIGFSEQNKMVYFSYDAGLYTFEDPENLYNEYRTGVDYLKKFYGEPDEIKTVWHNDRYKNDQAMWHKAIENKQVEFYSEWKMDGYYCLASSEHGGGIRIAYYLYRNEMPDSYLNN